MTHKNPNYKDREAIAPYNFVSLPAHRHNAKPPLPHDRFFAEADGRKVYSGQFDCELTTETPIFTRGMVSADVYQANKEAKPAPDFFSVDGNKTPALPGSSLRGLFRSLIEIITNSRPAAITDQRAVFRAVDTTILGDQYRKRVQDEVDKNTFEPKVQAGYIRKFNGDWYIQPAQTINGTTWCRISHKLMRELGALAAWPPVEVQTACGVKGVSSSKNARAVYILPGPCEWQDVRGGFLKIKFARVLRGSARAGAGLQVAALAESGEMDSKRSEAVVFAPDTKTSINNGWLPLIVKTTEKPEREIELDQLYREQMSQQQTRLLGKDGVLCDLQPVFYLVENGRLTFFGHTLMLRLPYQHAPNDLMPTALRPDTQDENNTVDMAEAIFGYVRPKKQSKDQAFAGRVSFSNATFTGNLAQPFELEITPKILSGPKTTTFQHYLNQQSPDEKEHLANYDNENAQIRGYKHYWHKGPIAMSDVEERNPEKLRHASQYTRIKAVKTGAQFRFSLRFENLREEELGALAWLLRCAADPSQRLKIGMGKPYGLGAIKITSQLRLIDRQTRYSNLFDAQGGWETGDINLDADFLTNAIQFFEQTMAGDTEKFMAQTHICDLLTMLQWPGPPAHRTRYMEIERRDKDGRRINEYRYRSVLPTPSFVVTPSYKGDQAPMARPKQHEEVLSRRLSQPPISSAANPFDKSPVISESQKDFGSQTAQVMQSLSRDDRVAEGEELLATIIRISANEYVCSLGDGKKLTGKLPRDERKGLKEGDPIWVKVKRIAGSGTAILTVKGLSKK